MLSPEHNRVIFWAVIVALLHVINLSNNLLFHTLIELFTIIIAYVIFLLVWESKAFLENRCILLIGIAYFFISTLDLLHTLSYERMGLFSGYGTNLPTQFWIAARYMESISFLVAPLLLVNQRKDTASSQAEYVKRSIFAWEVFFVYATVTLICILSIFVFRNFPDSYIENSGLTSFKIVSEYIISLIFFCSLVLLYLKKDLFEDNIFKLLVAAIILKIFSELALTAFTQVDDFSFSLGHYFKLLSFYLIYRAIVEMGFSEPYNLMFRELKYSEEDFRQKTALLWNEYNRMCGIIGIKKYLTEGSTEKWEKKEKEEDEEEGEEEKDEEKGEGDYFSFIQNFHGIGFQLDKNMKLTFLHGSVEEMTGYTKQDFLSGKTDWADMIVPEDRHVISENKDKLNSNLDFTIESEYRIRAKNGDIKWVRQLIQRIQNNSRSSQRFQGSIHDITQYKIAEEALKKIELIRIKEIHHRIKNNLQVISSLLNLQAEKFKDEKVLEAFRESQNRVASIAMIHEELHEGKSVDTLDFADYLQKLAPDLFSSYRVGNDNISLKLDLKHIYLGMDTAIPLGIIVNELVSNSLKHAFPSGKEGEIIVSLQKNKEFNINKEDSEIDKKCKRKKGFQYILKVADNGKGIPEEINFKETDSLGLQLVNILVEQIDGSIELRKDKGTEFTILFNNTGK